MLGLPGNWGLAILAVALAYFVNDSAHLDIHSPTVAAVVLLAIAGEVAEFVAGAAGVKQLGDQDGAARWPSWDRLSVPSLECSSEFLSPSWAASSLPFSLAVLGLLAEPSLVNDGVEKNGMPAYGSAGEHSGASY